MPSHVLASSGHHLKLLSLLFFFIVASAIEYFHAKQLTFLKNESYSMLQKAVIDYSLPHRTTIVSDNNILNNFSTLVTLSIHNGDRQRLGIR